MLVLLLFIAYPLVEIGKGDFDGDNRQERITYQVMGPTGSLDVRSLDAPARYEVRFSAHTKGQIVEIATLEDVYFPFKSVAFEWKKKSGMRGRHSIVIADSRGRVHILHHFGDEWALDPIASPFIGAMIKWLRS